MSTRTILSVGTPSRVAKFATKLFEKNEDGVVGGKPKVNTIKSAIFKSITVTPSIMK